jgi:hypothetical protein
MVCRTCGGPVEDAFCPRCGRSLYARTPPPLRLYAPPRVAGHLHTLGILWCVYGVYRTVRGILAALILMGVSTSAFLRPWGSVRIFPFMPYNPWIAGAATFLATITLIGALISVATGLALMQRKRWARTLALVMGILTLIRIPLGTCLGIYTLWVLAPTASAAEYDSLADRSELP